MKRYYAPTPKWALKLGDALLAVSSSITMYAIAENNDTMAYIVLITGVLGKFLTNLFSEDGEVNSMALKRDRPPVPPPKP